jgi:hypothetical protein
MDEKNKIETRKRLSTDEAAVFLLSINFPVGVSTLNKYRKENSGPVFSRVQRKVFYFEDDLIAFTKGTVIYPATATTPASRGVTC